MKTVLLVLLMVTSSAYAGPRNVGNGGGGVVKDGVYMTFGSAGVYVDPEPMREVPGMDLLLKTTRELKIPTRLVDQLMRGFLPLGNRKYFNVVKEKFDEATYLALKEEYAKLTKVPPESITIFAVTHPETRQTFLLPEFFGLKPVEQTAILFHEAYWVIKPEATYDEVVRAEIAFQKYVEARASGGFEYSLGEYLGKLFYEMGVEFNFQLNEDLATGALAELGATAEKGVPLMAVMAPGFHCDNHESYHWGYDRGAIVAGPGQFGFSYDLAQRFPNSNFLRFLLARQSDGANLTFGLHQNQIDYLERRSPSGKCESDVKNFDFHIRSGMVKDGMRIIMDQLP